MVLFKVMLYNPSISRPPENAVGDLTRVAPEHGLFIDKISGHPGCRPMVSQHARIFDIAESSVD